jgi:hypothetical protein
MFTDAIWVILQGAFLVNPAARRAADAATGGTPAMRAAQRTLMFTTCPVVRVSMGSMRETQLFLFFFAATFARLINRAPM